MCPHSTHLRRCSHHPPPAEHSTQPVPLGLAAGLMPSLSDFIGQLTGNARGHHGCIRAAISAMCTFCQCFAGRVNIATAGSLSRNNWGRVHAKLRLRCAAVTRGIVPRRKIGTSCPWMEGCRGVSFRGREAEPDRPAKSCFIARSFLPGRPVTAAPEAWRHRRCYGLLRSEGTLWRPRRNTIAPRSGSADRPTTVPPSRPKWTTMR